MYTLHINQNGKITAMMKAGKDLVRTELPEDAVRTIIDAGAIVESNLAGFGIAVGDWYFEGTPEGSPAPAVEEAEEEEAPKRSSKSPFSRR